MIFSLTISCFLCSIGIFWVSWLWNLSFLFLQSSSVLFFFDSRCSRFLLSSKINPKTFLFFPLSEIYKLMRKEYQRTQQGIEQEETEELGEEAPQVVDTQFKSRESSGWETIDLNGSSHSFFLLTIFTALILMLPLLFLFLKAAKQKKPTTSNMEVDDASPPRRTRHDSPDASPPRRTRHDSPSPPRRTRHDSPDASPPRRTRHDSPSPPRRPTASGDASPPRRPKAANSNDDDFSPPRRKEASRSPSPPRRGANAETIYRDKSGLFFFFPLDCRPFQYLNIPLNSPGKKVDVKLEKLKAEMKQKKKDEEAERHMVWGKGLAQQRQQEDRLKNLKEIAAMPFATYKGDLAKDETLKNIERWGDPMAGLVPVSCSPRFFPSLPTI